MSFRVDPESITRAAASVGDLRDDALAAERYVVEHLAVGDEEGRMFAQVAGQVEQVRTALVRHYQQLHTVVDGSAVELGRTAGAYRTTDGTEAARLDATY